MTAKEKVLSVYPDAVSCASYNKYGNFLFLYTIKHDGTKRISDECYNVDLAWESALNQLIKQGLCTE